MEKLSSYAIDPANFCNCHPCLLSFVAKIVQPMKWGPAGLLVSLGNVVPSSFRKALYSLHFDLGSEELFIITTTTMLWSMWVQRAINIVGKSRVNYLCNGGKIIIRFQFQSGRL